GRARGRRPVLPPFSPRRPRALRVSPDLPDLPAPDERSRCGLITPMRRPFPASELDSRNFTTVRTRYTAPAVHANAVSVPAVGAGTPHGLIDPPPPGEVSRDQETPTSAGRHNGEHRVGHRADVGPGTGGR